MTKSKALHAFRAQRLSHIAQNWRPSAVGSRCEQGFANRGGRAPEATKMEEGDPSNAVRLGLSTGPAADIPRFPCDVRGFLARSYSVPRRQNHAIPRISRSLAAVAGDLPGFRMFHTHADKAMRFNLQIRSMPCIPRDLRDFRTNWSNLFIARRSCAWPQTGLVNLFLPLAFWYREVGSCARRWVCELLPCSPLPRLNDSGRKVTQAHGHTDLVRQQHAHCFS